MSLKEVFEAREKSEIDNKVKEIFEKTVFPLLCNYETEVHPELWYTIFNSGFRYGHNEAVDEIEKILNKALEEKFTDNYLKEKFTDK